MKRTMSVLLAFLICIPMLCIQLPAQAADTVVFVDYASGSDTNTGLSPSTAYKTLSKAYGALAAGGVLVLTAKYSTGSFKAPSHSGTVTVTSSYGGVDYAAKNSATLILGSEAGFRLGGDTVFSDIVLTTSAKAYLEADGHSLTMGNGVTCSGGTGLIVCGLRSYPENTTDNASSDSYITINSGKYYIVTGFSAMRGDGGTVTYTGTSHITVNGGSVTSLYGASYANHISGSTVITINGGTVSSLYTGGDVTRRLNGSATVTVNGGTVSRLSVNNVVGNATVNLNGGSVGAAAVSYGNDTVKTLAAKSVTTLNYNALVYTDAQAEKLGSTFSAVKGDAAVFVRSGATGDGSSEDSPLGTLEAAYALLASGTGKIIIIGSYNLSGSFTEPAHSGSITLSGANSAALNFTDKGAFILNGSKEGSGTTIENLALNVSGSASVFASSKPLTIGEGITCSGSFSLFGGDSGDNGASSGDYQITVYSGSFDTVVGAGSSETAVYTGSSTVQLIGGSIKTVRSTLGTASVKAMNVLLYGADVGDVIFSNVTDSLSLSLTDGKIGSCAITYTSGDIAKANEKALHYDPSVFTEAMISGFKDLFSASSSATSVFFTDGGTGNGKSPSTAFGSLTDAVAALTEGGSIVICGPATVPGYLQLPDYGGSIIITSVNGGVDYRETAGAELTLSGNLMLGGETVFENINIKTTVENAYIICSGNKLTMGDGIECSKTDDIKTYLSIAGGLLTAGGLKSSDVTVNSGTYNTVRAGNTGKTDSDMISAETSLTINGGTFISYVLGGSDAMQSGTMNITVNGGTFGAGVYGMGNTSYDVFSGTMNITVNGGVFTGRIAPAVHSGAILSGTYNLTVNGGRYASLTEFTGPEEYQGGMKANVSFSSDMDLLAEETGTLTFKNYIKSGADPWVIYHEGYYYLTVTGSTSIYIARAVNLSDLITAPYVTVFSPASGKEYSKNLWSPELHYYSAEDFGEEYEGWYIYIACDDGDNINHRLYVLKALTDDPLGAYGNPVSKVANVPIKVTSKDDPTVNAEWSVGQTDLRYNGKVYALWIGEKYEGNRRYQIEYISELENPWTMVGKVGYFLVPTLSWEKGGATYSGTTIYPEVVEGATAVYGPNGEVYLVYSGSGYWTTEYKLGLLTLVGDDPLEYDSWQKSSEPIFSKSSGINGCGHASYTVSPDGKTLWICYHAYTGTDTSSKRFVFLEPYTVSADGVTIGNGTGRPADISTEYTITVNPMPLMKKIVGFGDSAPALFDIADKLIQPGAEAGLDLSALTVYGGGAYSAAVYGAVSYEYKSLDGLNPWQNGLPDTSAEGKYRVRITLCGVDNFSGITSEYDVTVSADAPAVTTEPAGQDSGSGSPVAVIIGVAAAVVIIAAAVFIIVKKKKK